MKNIQLNILRLAIILSTIGCKQEVKRTDYPLTTIDTSRILVEEIKVELTKDERQKEIELWERNDSIRLANALLDALAIAKRNMDKSKYSLEFESLPDSAYRLLTKISIGRFFSKHSLIIHRVNPGTVYINIYLIGRNGFQEILSLENWNLEYINDTTRDVNGDGNNDFLVNRYGNTGCCLKAYSDVYLYIPDSSEFSNKFEFINPTFSSQEKVIRGVCYGHPGETELYKYKWNGLNVDTIEFIYHDMNQKGQLIRSNRRPYKKGSRVEKKLKSVPPEYLNIYGYDWFTGEGYL